MISHQTCIFPQIGELYFLKWNRGKKSFSNQVITDYTLKFWLLEQSFLNRVSFLNRDLSVPFYQICNLNVNST